MNVVVLLAVILCVLMVLVGGRQGIRSFLSLFLNFGVLFVTIFLMTNPKNSPIILTFIACTIISCISLFYINKTNSKTITAFISTMVTIVVLLLFITFVTEKSMIQGFGEESTEEISIFSLYIGVNFVQIGASVIIMSTIGAIMDVAISIATSMHEIFYRNPSISRKKLFAAGLSIGRDILGTDTNTLFFAFFGGYLSLLIWFKDLSYSIGEIVNSKVFSAEMTTIFCAGIGIALIIPIASCINAYYLIRTREKSEKLL
ncbi:MULTISPECIES: YibE/F family protein [Lysinibacillus]|uniref:YibE/F family protein n=1 Tax=Lysinibacillus TaxID=400634 RepID=UPI00214BD052|nr:MULTISPECIES: YibE/F family protein [Lysinibacillus]UNT54216.1 YibE/F family protein [Lysinibacillus capsici]UUV26152.1 YibE/F family protein [Lysinibacillus sp. FN11]UYB49025.1 YibE/F family protein [Lysinibacillus capsici]